MPLLVLHSLLASSTLCLKPDTFCNIRFVLKFWLKPGIKQNLLVLSSSSSPFVPLTVYWFCFPNVLSSDVWKNILQTISFVQRTTRADPNQWLPKYAVYASLRLSSFLICGVCKSDRWQQEKDYVFLACLCKCFSLWTMTAIPHNFHCIK